MPATPTNLPKETIEQIAEMFGKQLEIKPAEELIRVVKQLGGEVKHQSADESQDGSIDVRKRGDFTIFLSPFTGRFRDRFTVAHELGHYVLHSRLGEEPLTINREGSDRAEWEANWFAAALLMPKTEFTNKAQELEGDLAEIAYYFDVSSEAAGIRKKSLGLP